MSVPRLLTQWTTSEEGPLANALRMVAAEPEHTILRYELEAALHSFQARLCYQSIDRLRQQEQVRAKRKASARKGSSS